MEHKLEKNEQNIIMDNFVKTDDILNDMCGIIQSSQKTGCLVTELQKKN